MTEEEVTAIRAQIVLDPMCDTTRLVYADALEEMGGDGRTVHARYIRKTIALEHDYGPNWFRTPYNPRKITNEAMWCLKRLRQYWPYWTRAPHPRFFNTSSYLHESLRRRYELSREGGSEEHGLAFIHYCSRLSTRLMPPHDTNDKPHRCLWLYRRGFISELRCHWDFLVGNGPDLFAVEPVCSVTLTERPTSELIGQELLRRGVDASLVTATMAETLSVLFPSVPPDRWIIPEAP